MSLVSAGVPVYFSCGRQGHGVNRCSQVDTSFPFLPPRWSVDVRNGQYRATRFDGTGLGSPPVGELEVGRDVRPLGSCRWGAGWDLTGLRTPVIGQSKTDRGRNDRELLDRTEGVLGSGNRLVPISSVEMEGSSWSVVPPVSRARKNRRGMRPAGGIRQCPPRVKNGPTDGEGKTQAIPLSVEAEEFSLMTESKS